MWKTLATLIVDLNPTLGVFSHSHLNMIKHTTGNYLLFSKSLLVKKKGKYTLFSILENYIFYRCISLEDEPLWCSTKVDSSGKHTKGNWGNCGSNCPPIRRTTTPSIQQTTRQTTTQRTTQRSAQRTTRRTTRGPTRRTPIIGSRIRATTAPPKASKLLFQLLFQKENVKTHKHFLRYLVVKCLVWIRKLTQLGKKLKDISQGQLQEWTEHCLTAVLKI